MIFLPQGFPAAERLRLEGGKVEEFPLREGGGNARTFLFLNLMPLKPQTDWDFVRMLANVEEDLKLLPLKIKGQTYKTTPMEHMNAFYVDFEEVKADNFAGLIITGAPVENLPFEEVRYWPQLCRIMDWADTHVTHTLYVCWGAQAGLYHHYGIPKHALPEKRFGIFPHTVLCPSPLFDGLTPTFLMPNSRHTEVRRSDIEAVVNKNLHIVADSAESGVGIIATKNLRRVFVVGHMEYACETLHNEYHRDLTKHLPIHIPEHYYASDGEINFSWRDDALRFYRNWAHLSLV